LNITNYFDCIEIADDFFEFFSYIRNKEDLWNDRYEGALADSALPKGRSQIS